MASPKTNHYPRPAKGQGVDKPSVLLPSQLGKKNLPLWAFVLTCVTGGIWGGDRVLSSPVEVVTITGDIAHVDPQSLQSLLNRAINSSFMTADLNNLRESLESQPWIYHAEVRRRWPAQLQIILVQQIPLARWGTSGYLNHRGEFFSGVQEDQFSFLPLLTGPTQTAVRLMQYFKAFSDQLAPVDLVITHLGLGNREQLSIKLNNGLAIKLGSEETMLRMRRFLKLWEKIDEREQISSIDLRYEFGAAIAFHETSPLSKQTINGGDGSWPR